MRKNKIGILTWHYYQNFGSVLQTFALQETIKSLGYDVEIINYRNPKFGNPKSFKSKIKNVLAKLPRGLYKFPLLKKINLNTIKFQNNYLNESKLIVNLQELDDITKKYDSIVYGSDQIWAPNAINLVYLGKGTNSRVKKISYAASIGVNYIPDALLKDYKILLSNYASISVREQEGKELLENSVGIDSSVVLDPTLLLPIENYKEIESAVNGCGSDYIFCYFLNNNHEYRSTVESFAKSKNLKIIGVSDCKRDSNWIQLFENIGADQFLWLIHHAQVVFTDSYHGAIFSLRYHKDLYIFNRFAESDPICQNSRIRQLANTFAIGNRIINPDCNSFSTIPLDYDVFEQNLKNKQKESIKYLKKALSEDA